MKQAIGRFGIEAKTAFAKVGVLMVSGPAARRQAHATRPNHCT